jgi:hypothetical protein
MVAVKCRADVEEYLEEHHLSHQQVSIFKKSPVGPAIGSYLDIQAEGHLNLEVAADVMVDEPVRWRRWLELLFSNYYWCRHFLGGRWELWLTVCGSGWIRVKEFSRITKKRPGGCTVFIREENQERVK